MESAVPDELRQAAIDASDADAKEIAAYERSSDDRESIMNLETSMLPAGAEALTSDGGLYKNILKPGEKVGGLPYSGSHVVVHYIGTLFPNGKKFDSSRDRGQKFTFDLGKNSVIKGWDLGVATMERGEVAELYCRADYAYGPAGSPPTIPGGACLKFEVEVRRCTSSRRRLPRLGRCSKAVCRVSRVLAALFVG